MSFKNEGQLYQIFTKAVRKLERIFRDYDNLRDLTNGEFRYIERELNGRQLHLLGEEHFSRKPADYVHQNLVAHIESSPQTWLVLREDAEIEEPLLSPTQFYIKQLAKLFRLPYEEALGDLHAQDTREYIKRKAKINEEDLDRSLLTLAIYVCSTQQSEDLPDLVRFLAEILQKPPGYTLRLLSMGPKNLEFEEMVLKHCNGYSREKFHQLLKKYPDRSNVLISVGYDHFPAFK